MCHDFKIFLLLKMHDYFKQINSLFILSVIFIIILAYNILFGENFMIELWNVSAILVPTSFAAWFAIHSVFGEKVVKKKKARLKKAYDKVYKIAEQGQTDNIETEMASLNELYESSNEPTDLYELAWNYFCYSGLIFLASIFCKLGAELLFVELVIFEPFIFLFGVLFFIVAILNTRNLMTLLKTDNDPQISLSTTLFVGAMQSLNTYILLGLLEPFMQLTLNLYQQVFFILLLLTFLGAGIFLLKADEDDSQLALAGLILMFAPWAWMVIYLFGNAITKLF